MLRCLGLALALLLAPPAGGQPWEGLVLDADNFGKNLPKNGARALLLYLSRPGCELCSQLDEKWTTLAKGAGQAAKLSKMECDPDKPAASGASNERFCFGMQTAEKTKMDFPRIMLFKDSKIYIMSKQVYMSPDLTKKVKDFVRGGYADEGELEGTYDATKECLPGTEQPCQLDFSFGTGLPVREDCMDLYKECGDYAEEGKCEMYKNVCEISCRVCRAPPHGGL